MERSLPGTEQREELLSRLSSLIASADGSSFLAAPEEESKAPIRQRALRLLDSRGRSRHELRQRLAENEDFSARLIEEVLDDLTRAKLIDDHQFADDWVRQRAGRRGKSRRALSRELREKGISADIREEALDQISDSQEADTARRLAEKKAATIRTVPEDYAQRQKDLRRIVGVLARRGFSGEVAMPIARQALDDRYAQLGG